MSFEWYNQNWKFDVGQIPKHNKSIDLIGGVAWKNSYQDKFNYTLGLERRRLNNSLLSYYGQTDANTHKSWGGVNVDQFTLNLSKNLNSSTGIWSYTDVGTLSGKNVADNKRIRNFTGIYHYLIDQPNQRLSVGTNTGLSHYQKNLGDYTLGQGGYYSPQLSASIGVPVRWLQTHENTAWGVEGYVGYSYAKHNRYQRYPIASLVAQNQQFTEDASQSKGVAYSFKAYGEHRLNSHFVLGASVNLEYQKDYAPSNAILYLKYSKAGWSGDMDLPVELPSLYADK